MGIDYSIITVCRNASQDIGRTIESVCRQQVDMSLVEMVIVDGASTDNTAEVVHGYESLTQKVGLTLRFRSEPDQGIYDAMNKGATRAQGTWCLFLNAGDIFFNEQSLNSLVQVDKHTETVVYGDYEMHYRGKYHYCRATDADKLTFNQGTEHKMGFCHQSALIRRDYLLTHPYSTQYRIASDHDFFLRAFRAGAHFKRVPAIICIFDMEGLSVCNYQLTLREATDVIFKNGLISQEEHDAQLQALQRKLKMRALVPKFLIRLRRWLVMWRDTQSWSRQPYEPQN